MWGYMLKRGQKKSKVKPVNKKKPSRLNNKTVVENNVETEQERIMLMRIGVACFMVIFFIAWIFNLRYQFKMNSSNISKSSFNWEQTRDELDKTLGQIKQGMEEIKQAQSINSEEPKLTSDQINLLKMKLTNEMASSTVATSTTATSTKINNK
jgi:hypothetical protein